MSLTEVVERADVKELKWNGALHRCAGPRPISIGLLGHGRVGQAVVALTASEQQRLAALGLDVFVSSALVRDTEKSRGGPAVAVTSDIRQFYRRRFDLVIEVMGGVSPAFDYVKAALERGIPVVTANKSLVAHRGEELAAIARFNGVPLAFDAAVLAGVPFLGALSRRPFINTPRRITGIINGTSHYLLSKLAAGGAFPDALQEATRLGYAEPDSSADVGGRDAAEKLTILLRLSGVSNVAVSDLTTIGIDQLTPHDFAAARRLGGVLKPLVIASLEQGNEGAWVGPALVDRSHGAAATSGVFNFVELAGSAQLPVTFSGPGAGPDVTAATILDDVVEVLALGGRPDPLRATARAVQGAGLRTPPAGTWYVRISSRADRADSPSVADAAEQFAIHRIPVHQASEFPGAVVVRTIRATWPRLQNVADEFRAIGFDVLALPVVEGECAS